MSKTPLSIRPNAAIPGPAPVIPAKEGIHPGPTTSPTRPRRQPRPLAAAIPGPLPPPTPAPPRHSRESGNPSRPGNIANPPTPPAPNRPPPRPTANRCQKNNRPPPRYGISSSLPTVARLSSSRCASAASASGNSWPMCSFSRPSATQPSTSPARCSSSARSTV